MTQITPIRNTWVDFGGLLKFEVLVFKYSILVVMVLLGQIDLYAAEHRYSNYVSGNSYQKDSEQFLNFIDEKFFSYEGDEKKLDVKKLRALQERA